jgi:SNF2 family DNA or RNA helicase
MEAGFLDPQQQTSLKKEVMDNLMLPPFLNENITLRDYQLEGVRWLIWYSPFVCCS